ncbi:MAG: Gfo/Idh/MocA family oxidoreductase [Akkermansiaceae bacterium]|nr:Gfo/Idh/MocA family oxidoreductase [Armatimonadota bacterium]
MSDVKRFVLFGAGFWARYQLSAWGEQRGTECAAVVDLDAKKALSLAGGTRAVFTDATTALEEIRPDFADIVTPVETHVALARLCLERGVPVICQKPLAPTVAEADSLVKDFAAAGIPLLVHENWRWQTPIRAAAAVLKSGKIGTAHRARVSFVCSFPVFDNQPFLATLARFILTDIGSHVLDVARFLFGEARSVYALTKRVNPKIAGEDVATVIMPMGEAQTAVTVEMSYASRTECERFPQTYLFVEGDRGSLEIGPDYLLRVTDETGTHVSRHAPPRYAWADPQYDLVQASMVPCIADLFGHLSGTGVAETTGADNCETLRLVFAAYESAESGSVVPL